MQISARVVCSPTEARRLLGQPDLLPLYQVAAETVERWIVRRIAGQESGATAPAADTADGRDLARRWAGRGGAGRRVRRA
jgi:hypothetical protein